VGDLIIINFSSLDGILVGYLEKSSFLFTFLDSKLLIIYFCKNISNNGIKHISEAFKAFSQQQLQSQSAGVRDIFFT
jgi:hypothetical protein